jgi:regulatory protein
MIPPSRDSETDVPGHGEESPTVKPGTITRIAEQRRKRGRVWVEIDGRHGLSLADEVVTRAGLAVGDELDEATLGRLLAADEVARATEAALAFLAYRPRSEKEVRDRLRRGGFEQEAIEQTIAKLHEWRYLDDADFARRWVESRTTGRPRGSRLLQQELWRKGIDRETVREVIDDAELDEAAAAEALARERLRSYAGEDPPVIRRRLGAYLSRRGYSYDVVRDAIERVLSSADDAEPTLE